MLRITRYDDVESRRIEYLHKSFNDFLRGRRQISTNRDAEIFFDSICSQESAPTCLEKISAHQDGLTAIHHCIRRLTTKALICKHVFPVVTFLTQPECQAICDGQLLQKLVHTIVVPPTAWKIILQVYLDDEFSDPDASTEAFASLCHQIINSSSPELAEEVSEIAVAIEKRPLISHSSHRVRELGYRIKKALNLKFSDVVMTKGIDGPEGRHDNDFGDFRKISVFPTPDELLSTKRPFYRRAEDVMSFESTARAKIHVDNQYRLLREDMLADLREDLKAIDAPKRGRRPSIILGDLFPVDIFTDDEMHGRPCGLLLSVGSGLSIRGESSKDRQGFLKNNPNLIRHQSFGAICRGREVVGFAFIIRDIERLAESRPVMTLQFTSVGVIVKVMAALRESQTLRFVIVDTPVFAYEPILERLKGMTELPLENHLLGTSGFESDESDRFQPSPMVSNWIEQHRRVTGRKLPIRVGKQILDLDAAQHTALLRALQSAVSIIQGPPGTGKSFVGALVAKLLIDDPSVRILVLAHTNHALDQFLDDIMKMGVSVDVMTRLGSKYTDATASLTFEKQFHPPQRQRSPEANMRLFSLKEELNALREDLQKAFQKLGKQLNSMDLLMYLEFAEDPQAQHCFDAFRIPMEADGFALAGSKGTAMKADFLIDSWRHGKGPGVLKHHISKDCAHVWNLTNDHRNTLVGKWAGVLREEQIERLRSLAGLFNETQGHINTLYNEARCDLIRTKRLIGCTTTAAAKYSALIKAAGPTCVLVEEAGEILEAHILAALTPSTKQLILIGDHKQLRPKCNNYGLTVEKGEGYDLNRSLFERLILQGHDYDVLSKQHRMAPEISQLIRAATYPHLEDGEKTFGRPALKGIPARVAFINHEESEVDFGGVRELRDEGTTASKQNLFEVEMVLKIVKYLGQQGYKTDNIVVLTPYLGQLRMLRDMLAKDNDPLLSDLDSYELKRAGLLNAAEAKVNKGRLRLSTIDNYQGEESDIVVASLTRSNQKGDIGFMKAPERLNVLLSRARNCLIMIGNMDTFKSSLQGKKTWDPFFALMKEHNYLQDGFWVRCERHPDRTAMLSTPDDFDTHCPDGGCSEMCGAVLACGIHTCQRRCHLLIDHTKTPCQQLIEKHCAKQHTYHIRCGETKILGCEICLREEAAIRRQAQKHLEIEKARLARQAAYQRELEGIQDEIAHQRRILKEDQKIEEQKHILEQERSNLTALKETVSRQEAKKQAKAAEEPSRGVSAAPAGLPHDPVTTTQCEAIEPGSAREEWENLKADELAQSDVLDQFMTMIGLEDVKRAFLNIKSKVDTAARQGISTDSERFGCCLLGNPGTGKTTVARLYARFLTSMGVIAGSCFKESTGSKLANLGVSGTEALVQDVLEDGGGVIFIDEAYQLSSGNSPGGLAVLDYLLAEVENLNSKIVFVLAGYAKKMESFFAHNPGFPSRFPNVMKFEDYTDEELLRILESKINKKYKDRMAIEDGPRGLYCRIAARRVGRGRGKEGFGNARAMENTLALISQRQSERLRRERRERKKPNDFLFTKEDVIGPEPSGALDKSAAWRKLQDLIGSDSVKDSVGALVDTIRTNYQRELEEHPIIEYNLNRVFLGSPGTGKTTVAKLYGQILVDLGMLSNGEVVIKNPADFVAGHLGQSEQQTKGILASTIGKVLVIDEAYSLYGGNASQGGGGFSDPYKTAVIDTIVAEIQSVPGEDRCVLLLGYRQQMAEMFQNVNPGLSRRFPLASAFEFEDFNKTELAQILELKLRQQAFRATPKAKEVALDMLERARNRPNFGNAGEIDILLNDAKARHQKRQQAGKSKRAADNLEAADFDEDFDRLAQAGTNVAQLFKDTVGSESIVAKLQGYQQTVQSMKLLGLDPKDSIPFTFLFRGPPGTGKTATARKIGKVYYDLGFLAGANVIDCSASDLIGQFIGQTGPKVRQLLDRALGGVLLIDEAYRLADGLFAKEALDEIVDAVTKENYKKRLIIIFAGYEHDINRLLSANPGLTSRFPETIDFLALAPQHCFQLLIKLLAKRRAELEKQGTGILDISCLENATANFTAAACHLFDSLSNQPNWASARDVETLAQSVWTIATKSISDPCAKSSKVMIKVSEDIVITELSYMHRERKGRATPVPGVQQLKSFHQAAHAKNQAPRPTVTTSTSRTNLQPIEHAKTPDQPSQKSPQKQEKAHVAADTSHRVAIRDVGVSDEVWDQLQADVAAEAQRERAYQQKLKAKREAIDDAIRDQVAKELMEEEERRKKEAAAQAKLQAQGRCPMGYHWIRQEAGWRCAGGSHFVTEGQLV